MTDKPLSLFELNTKVKELIQSNFSTSIWIIAEISEINENRSGHCYLELVEKGENDEIVARSKAIIWAYSYRIIKPYFETSTNQMFTIGIKVLINVIVDFHEVYGISLNIRDIEPSFTVGELEKQKQDTIKKLQAEGVIDMNKELILPPVIQKIAIISSKTAAGYEDFMNQLNQNQYEYKFYVKLFPAIMQGNEAVQSIMQAFDKIFKYDDIFDVVVLIRGGGSQVDLNCFNNYWLAYHITQFSLPVFTGIGHERDDTVADIVANTRLKTPTAVAEFIINFNLKFENDINDLVFDITDFVQEIISNKNEEIEYFKNQIYSNTRFKILNAKENISIKLQQLRGNANSYILIKNQEINSQILSFRFQMKNFLKNKTVELDGIDSILKRNLKIFIKKENDRLKSLQNQINLVNPEKILQFGYTITYKNNKIVKNIKELNENDVIQTRFKDGKVKSIVSEIKN